MLLFLHKVKEKRKVKNGAIKISAQYKIILFILHVKEIDFSMRRK